MVEKLPLNERDLENLAASFIPSDTANQAGIFRVDSFEGAEMLGRKTTANNDYAGMVFPYFLPEKTSPREYRIRRDKPDFERKTDGTIKEKGKYLSAVGAKNMLYFPPNCSTNWLENISLPIVITEGEKKTLALYRASWHGLGDVAEEPKFLAIGLSGVWNFRGTVGKTTNSSGGRQDVKGLISDFDLINWKKRKVFILFDADIKENEKVRYARATLARTLSKELGATVFLADCPDLSGCKGIDEVLGKIERDQNADEAVKKLDEILEEATSYKEEKISQANQILSLAEEIELFHNSEGEAFASIEIDNHLETHYVNSKSFRHYLAYEFYKAEGKSPATQAIQDTISALNGKALFEGKTREVFIRLAAFDGKIYLDLCNIAWQIVEIGASGWRIIEASDAPVRFRRTKAMLPLPIPHRNGDITKLTKFLNVDQKNLILILAWMVNSFRPDYPFPLLILSGEQGTAKSTTCKVLRKLIDPSITPFRSSPRDERDLIIAANNAWICAFDNLSSIPNWLSDALCRLSTGGGFGTRTLYSDGEETIFNAKRPIILNGIGDIATRGDLVDRAVRVKLEVISKDKRKPEREFWAEFEREKSSIFSALIDAVSFALRNIENITIAELPRMADFALWATASEKALGLNENDFLNAYTENREQAHSIVLEDSILAEVLQEYCAKNAEDGECKRDNFLLKDLLADLKETAGEKRSADKQFPKSAKGLRNSIERINPNLREIGIFITFQGRKGANASKGASLTLEYVCNETSPTSPTSQSPQNKADESDVRQNSNITHSANNITNSAKSDVCNPQSDVTNGNHHTNITKSKSNGINELEKESDVGDVSDVTFPVYSNRNEEVEFIDIEI